MCMREYQDHPLCDFLFCGRRLFGLQDKELLPYPNDADFGYSLLRTAYGAFGLEPRHLAYRYDGPH